MIEESTAIGRGMSLDVLCFRVLSGIGVPLVERCGARPLFVNKE